MGYTTTFSLKIEPSNQWTEIYEAVKIKFDGFDYAIDQHGDAADSCKWYEHEEEMREISRLYPDVLFHLSGEGEESGDIWEKHFLNGKMQACKAQIVIPPYDPEKLV